MSQKTRKTEEKSAALGLLDYVWNRTPYRSHRAVNEAMQIALGMAVESGLEWAIGDCAIIEKEYRPSYWMGENGWELSYSRACDGKHGPNPSAIMAIEAHLNRKPFLVAKDAHGRPRIRLHVGARFDWHDNLTARAFVTVTSFGTKTVKGQDGNETEVPCVVACTYQPLEKDKNGYESGPRKVDRLYKITHADIAEYHKAIREHARKSQNATPAEDAA